MSILELTDVSASYGPAGALFGIDLALDAGEMVGILGRNGAGKTSTFKAIMGMEVRRKGRIVFDGTDITRMLPEQIARAGIAIVPAERRIFAGLSVLDNLSIAASMRKQKLDIDEIVDLMPIMGRLIDREGYQLSGGEQQAVAIARALAARPRVLLLDEPTEGLAPVVVKELQDSIAALPERTGVAVLVAEQNLNFVLQTASRVNVLETGNIVHTSDSRSFAEAPDLQHKFLSVSSSH
jgi:ABC-type branched-subunit amino acid transport system ATPase component